MRYAAVRGFLETFCGADCLMQSCGCISKQKPWNLHSAGLPWHSMRMLMLVLSARPSARASKLGPSVCFLSSAIEITHHGDQATTDRPAAATRLQPKYPRCGNLARRQYLSLLLASVAVRLAKSWPHDPKPPSVCQRSVKIHDDTKLFLLTYLGAPQPAMAAPRSAFLRQRDGLAPQGTIQTFHSRSCALAAPLPGHVSMVSTHLRSTEQPNCQVKSLDARTLHGACLLLRDLTPPPPRHLVGYEKGRSGTVVGSISRLQKLGLGTLNRVTGRLRGVVTTTARATMVPLPTATKSPKPPPTGSCSHVCTCPFSWTPARSVCGKSPPATSARPPPMMAHPGDAPKRLEQFAPLRPSRPVSAARLCGTVDLLGIRIRHLCVTDRRSTLRSAPRHGGGPAAAARPFWRRQGRGGIPARRSR
ncbi:hypothetical protein B0H67DRAFT_92096 [Lasiosphaeris hirsuta]|uniref:Uncharacterized protein n=1 Tax=Lasiosphaeris hirsuta TaxID=260670 RepID=A0AA40EE51_9PEZI|nr:hypothetical protein B0H67DRAFT_92096 [Lasiosphaeris hirsuta]